MNIKKYSGWIIAGVIILFLAIWIGSSYNGMFSAEQTVDKAWGDVESQYQRRKDLIPNLENTVKAYAKHESDTYLSVTKARTAAAEAQAIADGVAQETTEAPADEQQMQRYMQAQENARKALDIYVNAVHEAYPELRSSQNFLEFQSQLEGTENRIQVARENYNTTVQQYNLKVGRFPAVIVANLLGFRKKSMFRSDPGAQNAPHVFDD